MIFSYSEDLFTLIFTLIYRAFEYRYKLITKYKFQIINTDLVNKYLDVNYYFPFLVSCPSSNLAPILLSAITAATAFAHLFLMTYLFSFALVTCSSVHNADWINHGCVKVAEAVKRSLKIIIAFVFNAN